MFDQTGWVVLGVTVVVAALIGFFVGRMGSGSKSRVSELESEVARQKDELGGYKRDVEAHFDKTAALFVSMAGSYKELIEHLSSSYHKLGEDGSRELFRDRVNSLLVTEAVADDGREIEVAATEVAAEDAPEASPVTEEIGASANTQADEAGADSATVQSPEPQASDSSEVAATPETPEPPVEASDAPAPVAGQEAESDSVKKGAETPSA